MVMPEPTSRLPQFATQDWMSSMGLSFSRVLLVTEAWKEATWASIRSGLGLLSPNTSSFHLTFFIWSKWIQLSKYFQDSFIFFSFFVNLVNVIYQSFIFHREIDHWLTWSSNRWINRVNVPPRILLNKFHLWCRTK